ncbi:hypothetical protein Tco_1567363 [Tanacetum coccineum]
MQGTLLTKQERECNLYDAFDKFAHIKEESLHQYYFRFTQLINDINIYKMKLEQFQVNTKFLNSLPTEWIHQDAYPQPQSVPQIEYNVSIVNQQTHLAEFPQIDSGLAVPVFKEGHMERQCPKPKRNRDATWFKDKVLLVEAQGNDKDLNEEELEFLADPRVA